MNVKISFEWKFLAGFWEDNRLEFNYYTANIDLLTVSTDVLEQNIAFLRLRYILETTLSDVVFVNKNDTDAIESLRLADIRVAVLPEDPVDQIVGMVLHSKLSAVLEERHVVRSVRLSSVKGEGIIYEHNDVEFNALSTRPGWWNTTDPNDIDTTEIADHASVITANKRWRDLDLAWFNETADDITGNVVVFGEFRKDEN